jgi:ADYC domain
MHKSTLCLALICSACAPSCAGSEPDDQLGEANQDMISLNGTSLNGTVLAGTSPLGVSLAGATLSTVGVTGIAANLSVLTAGSSTAPPLTTASVVGSTWTGTASNAAVVKLRIDRALQGTAPDTELWFYAVSYQTQAGWSPLCGLDTAGQPIRAMPVAGIWSSVFGDSASYGASSQRFTFACRTKTIGKCIELGYKPYKGYANQLASCVRMLRGDYCGSGYAHTVDGTTINLYDHVGVQNDTAAWPVEAEWTPSGAHCVNSLNAARWQLASAREPSCVKPLLSATCGASFSPGTYLIDELPNQ